MEDMKPLHSPVDGQSPSRQIDQVIFQQPPASDRSPPSYDQALTCPPGLECLAQTDHLFVKQRVEIAEVLTGCEFRNRYDLLNSNGRIVYKATEETDCLSRNCWGRSRPFLMNITDHNKMPVIQMHRPLRVCSCLGCWYPRQLQTLKIMAPPGHLIGTVTQACTILRPKFIIADWNGEHCFTIKGPRCPIGCCRDVEFRILDKDGQNEVGRIAKYWSGLAREAFTDYDNFGIRFPANLDIRMKATLVGAIFLIDFLYFESPG